MLGRISNFLFLIITDYLIKQSQCFIINISSDRHSVELLTCYMEAEVVFWDSSPSICLAPPELCRWAKLQLQYYSLSNILE